MENWTEQVQINFAKGVLGLPRKGVSNDFVRAELGAERVAARWDKLRLGYWHKLQTVHKDRAISKVLAWRKRGCNVPRRTGWLQTSREVFAKYGMQGELEDPRSGMQKDQWKRQCQAEVDRVEMGLMRARLTGSGRSIQTYESALKEWGKTPAGYTAMQERRRGQAVGSLKGTWMRGRNHWVQSSSYCAARACYRY